eukprot:4847793-Prymnesium_polylepis.1
MHATFGRRRPRRGTPSRGRTKSPAATESRARRGSYPGRRPEGTSRSAKKEISAMHASYCGHASEVMGSWQPKSPLYWPRATAEEPTPTRPCAGWW